MHAVRERMHMHVRRGDLVEVMTGRYKGKKGQVLQCIPKKGRVVVQGVNIVVKHVRRSQDNPYGARSRREAPIDVSNVLVVCAECDRGRRYGVQTREGEKVRVCKKCGKEMPKGSSQ
ncbi:MAG: 50S ribosomal protein L24 [Planctomycetota bacterium]